MGDAARLVDEDADDGGARAAGEFDVDQFEAALHRAIERSQRGELAPSRTANTASAPAPAPSPATAGAGATAHSTTN